MQDPMDRDSFLGPELSALQQNYQPTRIVEAPEGRQRAARVAESGTLGGGRPGSRVTVQPFEDLDRSFQASGKGPDPSAAFREIVSRCCAEAGQQSKVGEAALSDPSGTVLADGGFIWFALAGLERKPVGVVVLRKLRQQGSVTWEVAEFCVLAENRRKGVGRLLTDLMVRQYEEAAGDADQLQVDVPDDFEGASAFFRAMSFEQAANEDTVAGSVLMQYRGRQAPRGAGARVNTSAGQS